MRADLCEIASGKADKDEVIAYAKALLTRGQPLDTKPHWIFWGLAAPEALGGADARVDFLYTPTYTALAFLTRAFLMLPEEIGRLPDFTTVLRGGLLAATGRDFSGHGGDKMTTGNDRCVWYAAYGSNMLQERFLCYINHPELRDEEIGEYLNSRNAERGR